MTPSSAPWLLFLFDPLCPQAVLFSWAWKEELSLTPSSQHPLSTTASLASSAGGQSLPASTTTALSMPGPPATTTRTPGSRYLQQGWNASTESSLAAMAGLAVLLSWDFTAPGGKCGAKLLHQAATQGHLGMCLEEASPLEETGTWVDDPPWDARLEGWRASSSREFQHPGQPLSCPNGHPSSQTCWSWWVQGVCTPPSLHPTHAVLPSTGEPAAEDAAERDHHAGRAPRGAAGVCARLQSRLQPGRAGVHLLQG